MNKEVQTLKKKLSSADYSRIKVSGDILIIPNTIYMKFAFIFCALCCGFIAFGSIAIIAVSENFNLLFYLLALGFIILSFLCITVIFKRYEIDLENKVINRTSMGSIKKQWHYSEIQNFAHTSIFTNGMYQFDKFEIIFKDGDKIFLGDFRDKEELSIFQEILNIVFEIKPSRRY